MSGGAWAGSTATSALDRTLNLLGSMTRAGNRTAQSACSITITTPAAQESPAAWFSPSTKQRGPPSHNGSSPTLGTAATRWAVSNTCLTETSWWAGEQTPPSQNSQQTAQQFTRPPG